MCEHKRLVGLRSDRGDYCFADFLDERRLLFTIERLPIAGSDSGVHIIAVISACNLIITQKTNARQNTLALLHYNFNCGQFAYVDISFVEIVVEKSRVNAAAFERLLKSRIPRKTLK